MGAQTSSLSLLIRQLMGQKARKFLVLGLDNAGKCGPVKLEGPVFVRSPRCGCANGQSGSRTTLLRQLKLGEVASTAPTAGFYVRAVDFTVDGEAMNVTTWDFGGRCQLRPLWRHHYQEAAAVIFLVDSHDRRRMDEAKDELHRMLAEDLLGGVPLLVFANKQDLPMAMSKSEVAEQLGLGAVHDRHWFVQESAISLGKGVKEGLEWLKWALDPNNKLYMQTKCPCDVRDATKLEPANDKVSLVPTGDEPIVQVHV